MQFEDRVIARSLYRYLPASPTIRGIYSYFNARPDGSIGPELQLPPSWLCLGLPQSARFEQRRIDLMPMRQRIELAAITLRKLGGMCNVTSRKRPA